MDSHNKLKIAEVRISEFWTIELTRYVSWNAAEIEEVENRETTQETEWECLTSNPGPTRRE